MRSTIKINENISMDWGIDSDGVVIKNGGSSVWLNDEDAISVVRNLVTEMNLCQKCFKVKDAYCAVCNVYYHDACTDEYEHDYCHRPAERGDVEIKKQIEEETLSDYELTKLLALHVAKWRHTKNPIGYWQSDTTGESGRITEDGNSVSEWKPLYNRVHLLLMQEQLESEGVQMVIAGCRNGELGNPKKNSPYLWTLWIGDMVSRNNTDLCRAFCLLALKHAGIATTTSQRT